MTLDEFWNGPPELAKVYRQAYEIQERQANIRAWRAGMYTMRALAATVMNAFRKKGAPPVEYLKEPLPLTEQEVKDREIRDQKLREQRIIDLMERLASSRKTNV